GLPMRRPDIEIGGAVPGGKRPGRHGAKINRARAQGAKRHLDIGAPLPVADHQKLPVVAAETSEALPEFAVAFKLVTAPHHRDGKQVMDARPTPAPKNFRSDINSFCGT